MDVKMDEGRFGHGESSLALPLDGAQRAARHFGMARSRLIPYALLTAVLLGVVAVAAHGRPLGGSSRGGTPSTSFFDYVWTSLVLLVFLAGIVLLWAFLTGASTPGPMPRGKRHPLATLVFLAILGAIFWGLTSKHFLHRFQALEARLHLAQKPKTKTGPITPLPKHRKHVHSAQLRWDEVAIVLALLGALGVAAYAAARRRGPAPSWHFASQAAVSAALDESLDDLRNEPDIRKAIIAAYARMEHALAIAGLARRPSEAPLEYVERALGELNTSEAAIRRLTDLFEWAKFSHHEPEPSMRDEAIDALVAVRDELRPPIAEPAAA